MHVEHITDPRQFAPSAESFVVRREAENCLMLGLFGELAQGRHVGTGDPALYLIHDDLGDRVGAALWGGFSLILTRGSPESHVALADFLESNRIRYPMVSGPAPAVAAFAMAWPTRTNRRHAPGPVMRIMTASEVKPLAHPPAGSLRLATLDDLPLALEWSAAFVGELKMRAAGRPERVRWRVEHGCQYFWCDPDPVAMACAIGPTPTGVRIGFVYTPPALRRRGYASACVGELTRQLLERDRESVYLYAESEHPTANHVYESIGFQFVCDWQDFDLNPVTS